MDVLTVRQLALFAHVVSAIVLLAGAIATFVLAHLVRTAPGLEERRHIVLVISPVFERALTAAVPLSVLTGLVTLLLFGYSITDLWVVGTGAVLLALVVIETQHWAKVGPHVRDALERGDDTAALALARDPRSIAIGRLELALGFVIVALMVFRPNWPA